jgi:caa(3)-type oxidase subunit IV
MAETSASHGTTGYKVYWAAWGVLLVLTILMISIHDRRVLLCGIGLKSLIICAWFMHLKHESRILITSVAVGFAFALLLFFLIHFDAKFATL